MSLRVWLPLNRDLRNRGLSKVTVTNNGATFSDWCTNFTEPQYIQYTGFDATSLPELTIMCWAKPTNTNLDGVFDISRNNSFQFGIANNTRDGIDNCLIIRDNSTGLTGQYKAYPIGDVETGKWIHICCVYDKGTVKIYKNSILYSTNNTGGTHLNDRNGQDWLNNYWIGKAGLTNQYFSGSIYDFRIYDHALSNKEVVELARGCVLHYPCNDINSQVMNNVFTFPTFDTPDSSGGWSHWGTTGVVATYSQNTNKEYIYNKSNTYSHKVSCDSTSPYNYWTYKGPTYINETGYRSVQAIIKIEDGSVPDVNKVHWSWNGNTGTRPSNQYIPLGNGFYLIKCEGLQQSNRASENNNLIGLYTHPGNTVYISEAYCENDVQVCSNIWHTGLYYLKDVSGFDNHSLITGSLPLVTSPKTPRYNKCLNIDNSGTNKNYANCIIAAPQVKSASFWVYIGSSIPSGSMIIFQNKPTHLAFGFHQGTGCITYAGTSEKPCRYVLTNIVKYNSWNHFVISQLEDFTTELWLNGIKQLNPTNTYWGENYDGFCFGARNNQSSISGFFTGKISDFRLFSRVLTQADVDDLYKDSFAIDKLQNGYCYELNESDAQSSVDVKKNGQLVCKNYSEDFDALYLPAGTYVDTLLNFTLGDTYKAETFIKYDAGGSGRDLMGYSGYASGYWGVKADGTWEAHSAFSYTDADITKYNRIDWYQTHGKDDRNGNYKIGCLSSQSYSVRNKTIYHVKLWKNNVLERDLYPCSISNQVGLIDGLTGTFYPVQKINLTATDASLVSGAPEARLGKAGVTMNEIYEV